MFNLSTPSIDCISQLFGIGGGCCLDWIYYFCLCNYGYKNGVTLQGFFRDTAIV